VSAAHTESWVLNIVRTSDAALLVCDLSSPDVLDRTADCLTTLEAHKVRLVRGDRDPDPRARILEKRTRMVATKLDLPGSADRGPLIDEVYGERFEIDAVSAVEGRSTEGLAQRIFDLLRIVRVYSKPPGKEPDRSRPFVLPKGGTLLDFARIVHHDFAERLKFARLWGHGKFDGQRVTKDYVLEDGDVIELHA
jgi:ribosome-interacting GTPase 1